MIVLQKTLSDDDYVEKIRKKDRANRRIGWIWPILFILWLSGLFYFSVLVKSFPGRIPEIKSGYYSGFALGVTFGLVFVSIVIQMGVVLKHWLNSRSGFRTERLLIQYHDRLKSKIFEPDAAAQPPTASLNDPS